MNTVRPLHFVRYGMWHSADGRWAFCQHHSDPVPKRWFAYLDGCNEPYWDGTGDTKLAEVVQRVELDWRPNED